MLQKRHNLSPKLTNRPHKVNGQRSIQTQVREGKSTTTVNQFHAF